MQLKTKSDRVKGVDLHPNENWVLSALFSGVITIHNLQDHVLVKSIEVCNAVVRVAKFIPSENWIVTGSDDMMIRVFSINSNKKLYEFEAHSDYIRDIAVHPNSPQLLTSSDDSTIKLWSWENTAGKFNLISTFSGHVHYVMSISWNMRDTTVFASGSQDHTIKVWGTIRTGTVSPNFTLSGHEKGVNCVSYVTGTDKPYLLSASDDNTVRVWDYTTKQCLQVLSNHSGVALSCRSLSSEGLILTGGEDGFVIGYNISTFKQEFKTNLKMERVWSMSTKGSLVAFGTDDGTIVESYGCETPRICFSNSKSIFSSSREMFSVNFRTVDSITNPLQPHVKSLGIIDSYPKFLKFNSSGRYIAAVSTNQFTIYSSQALRSKLYGLGRDFAWSSTDTFAVSHNHEIIVYEDFKEKLKYNPGFRFDKLFDGELLGVRGDGFVVFYSWISSQYVQRIDVNANICLWNDKSLAICSSESLYILNYDQKQLIHLDSDGVDAFSVEHEHEEIIDSAIWIDKALVFVSKCRKIQILIGKIVETVGYLEAGTLIGYVEQLNALIACTTDIKFTGIYLNYDALKYKLSVIAGESADNNLNNLNEQEKNNVATFLDSLGHKELALSLTTNTHHQFQLALALNKLDLATSIANKSFNLNDTRWLVLGDAAMNEGNLETAINCYKIAGDKNSVLLLSAATGNEDGMKWVQDEALKSKSDNMAWLSSHLNKDYNSVIKVFLENRKYCEAALYAKTYCESELDFIKREWKQELTTVGEVFARALC